MIYGDVVLDRDRGVSICSTETALLTVARRLHRQGIRIGRMLWLGETDGVYDEEGETIPWTAFESGESSSQKC